MDEKKIVYDIIASLWNLVKEYFLHKMSDDEIEFVWQTAKKEENRFQQYGEPYGLLFRDIWLAFVRYYERKKGK